MAVPRQSAVYNEARNSSRVVQPPPDALPNALRALAGFREREPELYEWIAAGAPRLSEADHRERFGVVYVKARPKRGAR